MSVTDMKRLALELPTVQAGGHVTSMNMFFDDYEEATRFARAVRRKYRGAWQRGYMVLIQTSAHLSDIERFVREHALAVNMRTSYNANGTQELTP